MKVQFAVRVSPQSVVHHEKIYHGLGVTVDSTTFPDLINPVPASIVPVIELHETASILHELALPHTAGDTSTVTVKKVKV